MYYCFFTRVSHVVCFKFSRYLLTLLQTPARTQKMWERGNVNVLLFRWRGTSRANEILMMFEKSRPEKMFLFCFFCLKKNAIFLGFCRLWIKFYVGSVYMRSVFGNFECAHLHSETWVQKAAVCCRAHKGSKPNWNAAISFKTVLCKQRISHCLIVAAVSFVFRLSFTPVLNQLQLHSRTHHLSQLTFSFCSIKLFTHASWSSSSFWTFCNLFATFLFFYFRPSSVVAIAN